MKMEGAQISNSHHGDAREYFRESPIIGQKERWKKYIVEQLGPHFIDVKMIYNARKDGWKASNFHEKCDG